MLFRRFFLLCAAVAFCGAGFVTVLQSPGRAPYEWRADTAPACPFGVTRDCLRLLR